MAPRAHLSHQPKRHVDWFSRFLMDPKCYAVQCIVSGEENRQNCRFLLGFQHPAGRGPSHGHMQHVQKIVMIARVVRRYARGQTDRQTDVFITITIDTRIPVNFEFSSVRAM